MNAEPIGCPHGKVTSWRVTDALPGDRVPAIEHCDECNPGAVPLAEPLGACWRCGAPIVEEAPWEPICDDCNAAVYLGPA